MVAASRRIRCVAAGLAATAIVALAFAAHRLPARADTLGLADCVTLSTPSEQGACLEPYFRQAAESGNTTAALDELVGLFRDGLVDDCHMLAHHFGHVAFQVHGTLPQALRAGDARCSKGYYHGVVEMAVHDFGGTGSHHHGGDPADINIAGFCIELRDDAERYDACVHGVGHGLMHRFGQDVIMSLRYCTQLRGSYEQDRCYGGVFMQNAMQHLELPEDQYARVAPQACAGLALPRRLMDLCHGQIGEIAMFYYRHDLARATALCQAIADERGCDACQSGAEEELDTITAERRRA